MKKVAKSSAVNRSGGGGGGGQRRECSGEITHVWSAVDLVVKCEDLAVWTSAEKDESKD